MAALAARRSRRPPAGVLSGTLALAGVCLFALFSHGGPPRFALAGLLGAATVIALSTPGWRPLLACLGLSSFSTRALLLTLVAVGLGVLVAIHLRSISGLSLLPQALTGIAAVAQLIGVTEELFFRGYLQGKLSKLNGWLAAGLAALGHTLYKYLILAPLAQELGLDLPLLLLATLAAGLLLGGLRVLSGSIIPACAAHAAFDIIIYGGLTAWPAWVWS